MVVHVSDWKSRLPEGAIELVSGWLAESPVMVRLARSRSSKHGDFHVPRLGRPAFITVNHDLHPVRFLITLAHEVAHYRNWKRHGRRAAPHGPEWRAEFRKLLAEFLEANLVKREVAAEIYHHYFERKRIGSGSSEKLNRLLGITPPDRSGVRVEDLPEGTAFRLKSGRAFIKGRKMRKRYQCREIVSSRIYSIHPQAEVKETLVS
jgi:SprT protein